MTWRGQKNAGCGGDAAERNVPLVMVAPVRLKGGNYVLLFTVTEHFVCIFSCQRCHQLLLMVGVRRDLLMAKTEATNKAKLWLGTDKAFNEDALY